jgi:GMP synthase (glutamine-hydrolysing)
LDRSIEPSLVHATHVDSIAVLPPGAEVLARTEVEPHAAVRFGEHAWGLQFHPEFDVQVMTDYVEARAERLAEEGKNPAAVLADIRAAHVGNVALRRFVEHGVFARSPETFEGQDASH